MQMITMFASSDACVLEHVGGKALALIRMTREGMPVPPGFVLTVAFFEPWIATLLATPEWIALQEADANSLGVSARALQTKCRDLAFAPGQATALSWGLDVLSESSTLFAVRSSSPEEDLDGASFAGGYETTLGVTPATVEAAIRHSFASGFDERVLIYKRERAIPTALPRIAVIVQHLVDATSAGVAFSLNPLNNCYDEVVINANQGLGESVVAGASSPDVFVVDKLGRRIIDTTIGAKELVITVNRDGGTIRTTRSIQPESCLTPAEVLRVADLVETVEGHYRKPIDIEWAFAGDDLYLLQARPITTYLPLPNEMVTAPGRPKRLYADATLIEQGVDAPLSPLGTDFLSYVLKQMSGPVGGVEMGIDGIAFTAGGRYYMNLSHSLKLLGTNGAMAPGAFGDASVKAILEQIDLQLYLPRSLPPRLQAAKRKMAFTMIPALFPIVRAYWRPEALMRRYRQALPRHLEQFEAIAGEQASMSDLANKLTALLGYFFIAYGMPMIFASRYAERQMSRMFRHPSPEVRDHLISLGASLPGNRTAEMGKALLALATSPEMARFDSVDDFMTQLQRRELDGALLEQWDRFMVEFGARCPREIDVATPRPNEQPSLLFQAVKNLAHEIDGYPSGASLFDQARAKREAAYLALHRLALQQGKRKAKALEKHYNVWLTLAGFRETGKHYVIEVVDRFRKRVLQVANSLVIAGRLDEPDQIFDLTVDDIDRALLDPAVDLRTLAQERSAFINRVRRSRLAPHIIDSRGKIFYPPRAQAEAGTMVGVAISPGIARGRVKVLRSMDEKKLLPGEILVARATDPGWTPLFINAKGIILEIGGALQHGAVVAREYGIPCVSGLFGATDLLEDGQLVEVDGSNGVIRIIE